MWSCLHNINSAWFTSFLQTDSEAIEQLLSYVHQKLIFFQTTQTREHSPQVHDLKKLKGISLNNLRAFQVEKMYSIYFQKDKLILIIEINNSTPKQRQWDRFRDYLLDL